MLDCEKRLNGLYPPGKKRDKLKFVTITEEELKQLTRHWIKEYGHKPSNKIMWCSAQIKVL